jgi:hypothetical protein
MHLFTIYSIATENLWKKGIYLTLQLKIYKRDAMVDISFLKPEVFPTGTDSGRLARMR